MRGSYCFQKLRNAQEVLLMLVCPSQLDSLHLDQITIGSMSVRGAAACHLHIPVPIPYAASVKQALPDRRHGGSVKLFDITKRMTARTVSQGRHRTSVGATGKT
ncbi:hypothetical protein ZHAS_00018567 [Anopheles sinensis]|uniref:Uncharacterized protein n=1 Tax=Anopheles sinensis TaxID=74873 RepID=A0A084WJY2_ANOSI|nr:hypothetical protein ZHAS_00018567 [Anopheles sinensis]